MTPLRKRMTEELQLRNLSATTVSTYVRSVERFAKYFRQSPEMLDAEHVRNYLLHLKNDRKVQTYTILVNRSALRFLYVNTLKRWTIIATFYATALRCDELRNLKVGDIDGKRMVIFVRQAKGGVPREIPLSPVLLEDFVSIFAGGGRWTGCFPSKQRQDLPFEDASIRVLCRKAGHRAGIGRRVHPNLFRHACATHMLDAGADLRTIQVLLGHGDIRTTAKYLRVSIQSPFDTPNVQPFDRSGDDGRQK